MSKSPKKKSSKANTPSWRTMLRKASAMEKQAKKIKGIAGHRLLARASVLREQANLKHRSERKAKAPKPKKTTRKKRIARAVDKLTEAMYGDNAPPATLGGIARLVNQEQGLVQTRWQAREKQPGRGEIVGGEMHKLAEEIATLARKKGGKDEIQSKLMMATATAAYEGERKADKRHMQNVKDIHEAHTDKVVCGFIATFEATEQRTGMLPAVNVSAYTMALIVDALNRAGYTAKGKH